ncbi:putative inorganic phosphate cotransporter isoform X1 [Zootermopsis nevadensis]|uniref:putative inorganic phosphate cotransporter isoform X1 n=2 Tax=Zootermopsis nevadensis TaxID=136037 RepID=UPI000B8EB37B|nr:putative inorganic phosphate cotransporter isoform X1 [Zootermopsis nevadensis]
MVGQGERLVVQPGQNHMYVPVRDSGSGSRRLSDYVKIRYVFAVLGFILMAIVYGLKVNLSVAIVGMRNHTAEKSGPINITQSDCPSDVQDDTASKDGPFEWGEEVNGVILSSYFFGYLVSQVPGGRAAEVFSAKWILFASVALNIIPTLLTPPAVMIHWSVLVAMRIIEGVGGGFSFPALHVMISRWAPVEERSLISSIIYAGTAIGTVLSLLFTGLIVDYINWEAAFYIMGGLSSIWCLLWWLLMTDSPRTNPYISDEERDYITSSLGEDKEEVTPKKLSVPWKHVWTSSPFYAILFSHMFSNFGWYMLLIETPIYYDQVLRLSMNQITIYSSLPFFTLWLFSLALSACQSKLIRKKILTVTAARKIATFLASALPALCLVAVNFLHCEMGLIFAFMAVGTTLMGGMFSGFLSNHIDIAPRFAGTLMGITNTVATIPGIVVPIIVGQLTKTNHTREQWGIILNSAAAFLIVESVVYTVFGSGQEQPWNNPNVAIISKDVEQKEATEDEDEDTKM